MSGGDLSARLDRVYGATGLNDLEHAYNEWADQYDEEVSRLGYLLRAASTGYIGRWIKPEQDILDAGAGTGLIGSYLQLMGYQSISAIDLSDAMLRRARAKQCYREVRRMVLGEPLDFPDNRFDAAYAVGVFTEGHAPPEAFREIARVVKPGGRIVFSIRDDVYRLKGYQQAQDSLEEEGIWRKVDASPLFKPYPASKPELRSRVFVYETR
jgi:SAM-dependent methyltransferase